MDPKQISVVFKSEKQNNKQTNKSKTIKKKTNKQTKNKNKTKQIRSSPVFITFPTFPTSNFNFPPSLSQFFLLFFSIFTPSFRFFPCLFFPDTSTKIYRSEVSWGQSATPAPPVTPLFLRQPCYVIAIKKLRLQLCNKFCKHNWLTTCLFICLIDMTISETVTLSRFTDAKSYPAVEFVIGTYICNNIRTKILTMGLSTRERESRLI